MKLVYCTNVWSHHQAPIGRELALRLGNDFRMCVWESLSAERRQLGWQPQVPNEPWLLGQHQPGYSEAEFRRVVMEADVAVLGACPGWLIRKRAGSGKLTLVSSERLFKIPLSWRTCLNPVSIAGIAVYRHTASRPNVHYLAIGSGAAEDARQIGGYRDRIWNWGYFASVPSVPPALRPSQEGVRIVWVGRMLPWKRVDLLLAAVAQIAHEPMFAGLTLIGGGPEEQALKSLAQGLGIAQQCDFASTMPADMVREDMRQSHICVVCSDRNEGWGVAMNEAMAEGAVLVANRDAGAAGMLVRDGVTGFLFANGDVAGLAALLRRLILDAPLRDRVALQAWQYLHGLWSPAVAAERLISLWRGLAGETAVPTYSEGPCSRWNRARLFI